MKTVRPLKTPYSVSFWHKNGWLQGQLWSQAPEYRTFWVRGFDGKTYKVKKTYKNGSQYFRVVDIYG